MGTAGTTGYRGIWHSDQPTGDEYVYKYSGGLGTYCAKHIPMAIHVPAARKTFFVYGGLAEGSDRLQEMIGCYDHRTGRVSRPTRLMDKGTRDAHDNPVISIDHDGRIWVFASSHGTARPSYVFRSRRPYDIASFDRILETNFSYPQPWYIDGEGFLFLHTLYAGGRALHWSTSRDGVSWTPPRLLSRIEAGHYQVSRRRGRGVGTAFNVHPDGLGLNFRTNLYYLQTDDMGRTWRTADGRAVPTPLRTREDAAAALVHDYDAEGRKVYLKDLAFDAEGRPAILHLVSFGWEPGPENGPREWRIARWTGSEWTLETVTRSDNNYDTGCLFIEPDGVWRVFGPTEPGPQRGNPGGEVAIWIRREGGTGWARLREVTRKSPMNHTYVRRVVDAAPDFYVFWADGNPREPSESRLYFSDREGDRVFRLPDRMTEEWAEPIPVGGRRE